MKKAIYIFIYLLFCGINLSAQGISPCLPSANGFPAGDEPPGCFLCGPIFVTNTGGFTASPPNDNLFPCGTVENNQFISFVADSSGLFEGTIWASNCVKRKGIEMIIFDQSFNPVSVCYITDDLHGIRNIYEQNLIPGEIYWMMIDGKDGDECEILLTVTSGFEPQCDFIPTIQPTDASFVCVDTPTEIEVNVNCQQPIQWKVDSTGEIRSGQGTNKVIIQWSASGTKCIEIQLDSNCYPPMVVKETIEVLNKPPFVQVTELVCPEDSIPPPDTTLFSNQNGCPFFEIRNYEHRQTGSTLLFIGICNGDTARIDGINEFFTNGGDYNLTLEKSNRFGCDSLIRLRVRVDTTIEHLQCRERDSSILFSWNGINVADGYSIFVDDVFVQNQTMSYYIIDGLPPSTTRKLSVLPFSNDSICKYESLHKTCMSKSDGTTNLLDSDYGHTITLLPNPTSGKVQITSPTAVEWIHVFDISGKEILHSTKVEIDLSGQASGVYFFKIKTQKGIITKRAILL